MRKLAPKHHGPFKITKRVSPVAYQLELPTAWTIHNIFHASLLTPYHETMEHGTNYMRPPPDLIEDAEEYEVEAIINYHYFGHKQQLQYLIKWKGYPDADNTWESADHVHAPALIQVYHWKNPLSTMEQDKRGRRKHKVSINSLKSFQQQHSSTTTRTCPLLSKPMLPSTTSKLPTQRSLLLSTPSNPLLTHLLPNLSSPPSHALSIAHLSPLTPTPSLKRAKSSLASATTATPSPLKVRLMSLQGHPELDASTLRTIAMGLANMAIGHTFQHLKSKSEIKQLHKELTDLCAQMLCEPNAECPEGFEENHSRLPNFTIPDTDGIMCQARYIKLGNNPVLFALGTLGQDGNPIFQYDLFTAPSYNQRSPIELLPMSFANAILRKASSFHQAMELAHGTDNWGLVAKITRYHESDTRVLNIVAEIHVLNCELIVVKVASRQSHA